jgi:hypothetical protein
VRYEEQDLAGPGAKVLLDDSIESLASGDTGRRSQTDDAGD